MSAARRSSGRAPTRPRRYLAVAAACVMAAALGLAAMAPAVAGGGTQDPVGGDVGTASAQPVTTPVGEAGEAASPVATSVVSNPLELDLAVRPGTVRVGQPALARAMVRNLGDQTLRHVEVELETGAGLTARDGTTRIVGDLRGGERQTMRWRICGDASANHVVVVRARATSTRLATGYEAVSGGQLIAVLDGGPGSRQRAHCP